MKGVSIFFILVILTFGCENPTAEETPLLKDGEYIIKLYSTDGELLLTRKGTAENLGAVDNYYEIRLLDPFFGLQKSKPLETFASLTIFGQSLPSQPHQSFFNTDNTGVLHQRWYSASDDWGYRSRSGTLKITKVENLKIAGSFQIELIVDGDAEQNPNWGDRILAKGYFVSICPYEDHGVCP